MVFYRNAFKIFIRINDITEKLLQNAVEWRLFELHSVLQCRDNYSSISNLHRPLILKNITATLH